MGQCISTHNISMNHMSTSFTKLFVQNIFLKWKVATSQKSYEHKIALAHTRIAQLYQQIVDNEENVRKATVIVANQCVESTDQSDDAHVCCIVCFERVTNAASYTCSKDANHIVCGRCMGAMCESSVRRHAYGDRIACPCMTGCDGSVRVVECEWGLRMLREEHNRSTIEQLSTMLLQEHVTLPLRLSFRLPYLMSDGSFRAYSCSECGYGPIEHMYCDDLREYHNVNGVCNACPKCGHLEGFASSMSAWDGNINLRVGSQRQST